MLSYCQANGKFALSIALCGDNAILLRNMRLALAPLLIFFALLSGFKTVSSSSKWSQWLFLGALSSRGLILEGMYAAIVEWSPKADETHHLILSTVIAMVLVSSGPAGILMDKYLLLCLFLFLGAIAAMLITHASMIYLILLIIISIPVAGIFNANMEKCEQRFFAFWELLCDLT
ncbi:hypothetical protein HDU97_008924 [Phlyctochytrium planicorne]|nr:hypothetical protein HDU97_008924 [Phlyctochytrium planicorne]